MEQKLIVAGAKNLVIDTITHQIANTNGLKLIASVEAAAALQSAAVQHHPDCIFICPSLLDTLPEDDRTEFLQNHNTFNLLVGTLSLELTCLRNLLAGGVRGIVLLREICIDQLVAAIKRVAVGKHYFSDEVAQMICDSAFQKPKASPATETLTEREIQVLRLVTEGNSSKQIARILGISPATVGVHRRNIMVKTGVHKSTAWSQLIEEPA